MRRIAFAMVVLMTLMFPNPVYSMSRDIERSKSLRGMRDAYKLLVKGKAIDENRISERQLFGDEPIISKKKPQSADWYQEYYLYLFYKSKFDPMIDDLKEKNSELKKECMFLRKLLAKCGVNNNVVAQFREIEKSRAAAENALAAAENARNEANIARMQALDAQQEAANARQEAEDARRRANNTQDRLNHVRSDLEMRGIHTMW